MAAILSAIVPTTVWNGWTQAQRDNYPGGQYTSLTAWWAARQPAGGTLLNIEVAEGFHEDFGNGELGLLIESTLTISATDSSTNYVIIRGAPGHETKGIPGSGFALQHSTWNDNIIIFSGMDYYQLTDFEIRAGTDIGNPGAISASGKGAYAKYQRLVANLNGKTGNSTSLTDFRENNTVELVCSHGFDLKAGWNEWKIKYKNCVNSGSSVGFSGYDASNLSYVENCVAYNCTTDFQFIDAVNSSTNATSGAVAPPGAGSLIGITSTDFVDAAGSDFHITTSSALYQKGADLSAFFTTDIDGDLWVVPWSIGFDQPQTGGGVVITGSGALVAGNASSSGAANRNVNGAGAVQAGQATFTGSAERMIKATGTLQSAAAQTAGSGNVGGNISGAGTLASANAVVSGTATRQVDASGVMQAGAAALAGAAERHVKGSGVLQSASAQAAGSGAIGGNIAGSGAISAAAAQLSGIAERIVSGAGAVQAGNAAFSGTATRTIGASGALQPGSAGISGSGGIGGLVSGTGALQAGQASFAGSAARILTGQGAVQAGAVSFSGAGDRIITASGALQPGSAGFSGSGTVGNVVNGAGALVSDNAQFAGSGTRNVTASGVLLSDAAQFSGSGAKSIAGAGILQSDIATLNGYDLQFFTGNTRLFSEKRGRRFRTRRLD